MLVVDDEPSIRLLCRVNLELGGYAVLEADNLEEARRQLAGGGVSVMLIDVHVHGQDGRDLVRELRKQGTSMRIALITGTVDLSTAERAGADAVLEKPFRLEQLLQVVQQLDARVDSRRK